MAIKRQSITFPDLAFEDPKLNALMQFIRAQASELQKLQQMLRAGKAGQVLEKSTQADYDAGWQDATGAGAITGAENVGGATPIFAGTAGTLLKFRTLIEGSNVVIVEDAETITIAATITGGTGTVTSVGIHSSDLTVSGSPVTTDGLIELEIAPQAVTYGKIQATSADAVVLGRRTGEGPGQVEELSAIDLAAIVGGSGYPRQLGYAGIV